jgi:hypothetical protein
MDCEKFEPLLLDELYDELDELTSAAVKRHVSGCSRCGSILSGLRSTRRAVTLPMVAVPDGLEDRILAAAREAQKVVPIRSRMSRAVSAAGSWAMRPQTAMAAVFLLMIGSSAFLIRSKNPASKEGSVAVTVQGNPSPTAAPLGQSESLDDKAAAAAHGPGTSNVTHPPVSARDPAAAAVAAADESGGVVDALGAGGPRDKGKREEDHASLGGLFGADDKDSPAKEARPAATAPPGPPPVANAAAPAGAPYGGAYGDPMQGQLPAPKPLARTGPQDRQAQDPFSMGMASFRQRNYAEATRLFDQAAQSGDTNAALWAADSVREGQGCVVALGRFDQLASRSSGWVSQEASLRAARCQIAMGQLDAARDRLTRIGQAGTAEQKQAAQQALGELNQTAARKAGGGAPGGAAAAPAAPKRAAPARAASPARAPNEAAEQKKSNDTADTGY